MEGLGFPTETSSAQVGARARREGRLRESDARGRERDDDDDDGRRRRERARERRARRARRRDRGLGGRRGRRDARPRRARRVPHAIVDAPRERIRRPRRLPRVAVLLDRPLSRAPLPSPRSVDRVRRRRVPREVPTPRRRVRRRAGADAAPRADIRGGVLPRVHRHSGGVRVRESKNRSGRSSRGARTTRRAGYRMHEGGETDTRGCYTALAVAHLCGVMDDAVTENVSAFVARCQARSVRQTFFTHRSVSTFDRVPFQLMTDEHAHADARRRDRGRAGRGGARRVHVLRARRRRAVRRRARARPPGASALAVHATGRGRGGGSTAARISSWTGVIRFGKGARFRCYRLSVRRGGLRAIAAAVEEGCDCHQRRRRRRRRIEKERGSSLGNIAGVPACALFPARRVRGVLFVFVGCQDDEDADAKRLGPDDAAVQRASAARVAAPVLPGTERRAAG